jgi:hypothetical protein
MCADDRRVWLHEQIRIWVGEKRIDECLSALELGNLSMTEKAVAYRSVLIVGSIKHCRKHKRAEARIPILTLITYLSDNAKGTCYLSITKVMELLDRSRQCVVDNILGLEEDGLIGVARVDGMPNCYWPRIPAALKEMSPNPIWVIDALTTVPKARIFGSVEEAIVAATERSGNQSSGVDQSGRVDRYRSSGVDPTRQVRRANQSSLAGQPVHSSTHSISSLNLFSSSRGVIGDQAVDTTKKGAGDPDATPGKASSISQAVPGSINGKSATVAALGGQGAYAARNIIISDSGKLIISEEFRAELRETYNNSQIERGIERAPSQAGGSTDPVKLIHQIRRCCSYAKQDDERDDKRLTAAGKVQSARRNYAR